MNPVIFLRYTGFFMFQLYFLSSISALLVIMTFLNLITRLEVELLSI